MNRIITFIICIFTFGLTISSCGQKAEKVERKEPSSTNLTSHTFNFPVETLRDTIVALFDFKQQYDNPYLKQVFFYYFPEGDTEHIHLITFNAETAKNANFGKKFLKKSDTENDVYLHAFGDTWDSPIYNVKGKPLKYRTPFVLKLKKIDTCRTQLTIEAEEPVVINGTSGIGPHGSIAREERVQPTNIEEHLLLLYIAVKLGDKTLKPLKMPAR